MNDNSIHQTVYHIFKTNPRLIYTSSSLTNELNKICPNHVREKIIATILTRLYCNGLIKRTKVQLTHGYHYSKENVIALDKAHRNYLLPLGLKSKSELLSLIELNRFPDIKSTVSLNIKLLESSPLASKYSLDIFKKESTHIFLAMLVSFIMCDGSIDRRVNRLHFFIRQKEDIQKFTSLFNHFFPMEDFIIRPLMNGSCYSVPIARGSSFAKLLNILGAPSGNKVFQPFLVPEWIMNGSDSIKKEFLSILLGSEGSAPSHGRWRIQFVLSKSPDHIENLLLFLNPVRSMLYHFSITTSHIQLRNQKGRQYHGRFYIKGKENLHKFYKQFSLLYASEKQKILEELIRTPKNVLCNDGGEHLLTFGDDEKE